MQAERLGLPVAGTCLAFTFAAATYSFPGAIKRTIFLQGKPTDDMSVHLVYNAEGRYANIVGM